MIPGRETIARDRKEFNKTRDDNDRKGFIFSVPFYGEDGKYRGAIQAVVRTNVLCRQQTVGKLSLRRNFGLTAGNLANGHPSMARVRGGICADSFFDGVGL